MQVPSDTDRTHAWLPAHSTTKGAAPARSQPRWVAAGEPHSNTGFGGGIRDALGFGSYGPHGSTLILYPPSYPYTLYPSQTNCECAKHEYNTYNKRSYLCDLEGYLKCGRFPGLIDFSRLII